MRDSLRDYIENLFAQAPKSPKVNELKEELLSNVTAKFDDLIAQGRSEEEAYKIAVGGIGDVNELIKSMENDKIYNYARQETERQKSAIFVSIAVGLYIVGAAALILVSSLDYERGGVLGVILMLIFAAIATSMLVYNGMVRSKYRKADDTIVEEFKEWKSASNENRHLYKSISSAMWPLIVAIYFLVSFFFGAWAYSWVIFIIGAAIQNIIKLVFEMRNTR